MSIPHYRCLARILFSPHGGVGGAVSGDDDVSGEPNGETGGDDGVVCMGQVICIYPYVPLTYSRASKTFSCFPSLEQ